ncbi:MAG: amidohydrolase [Spirochaetia bacterium]|nr:amidohydrolase [Spirochaetia bacterium]
MDMQSVLQEVRGSLKTFQADTVLINGSIITMDDEHPSAEAMAVTDGRIGAVGTTREILHCAGPLTNIVDLAGRTAVPGFIESHNHLLFMAADTHGVDCSPVTAKSIEHVVERLRDRAAETKPGSWIEGWGFDDLRIAEKRHLSSADLDRVSLKHPVCVFHNSRHFVTLNSEGLLLSGISAGTPQPPGGYIGMDNEGAPNGMLAENSAIQYLRRVLPPRSAEELASGLIQAGKAALAQGITSVHDAAAGTGPADFAALTAVISGDYLPVRVQGMVPHQFIETIYGLKGEYPLDGLRTGSGTDRLKIGPVKICIDGSIQGYTAALSEPYHNNPGTSGFMAMDQHTLDNLVKKYHELGFQIAAHANGDMAIGAFLHAVEKAQRSCHRINTRHRLEHCQMVTGEQLKKMAALGINASFFSPHIKFWGDFHYDRFLGPDRANRISPLAEALHAGIRFGIHSDAPVTPLKPLVGMECAVNRLTETGRVLGEDQRITPEQALRAYTLDAAYIGFEEHEKGSISPGKLADITVLSGAVDGLAHASSGKNIQIDMTVIGGKICYKRSS